MCHRSLEERAGVIKALKLHRADGYELGPKILMRPMAAMLMSEVKVCVSALRTSPVARCCTALQTQPYADSDLDKSGM